MIEANNIKKKEAVERRGRKRQRKGEEERGSGKERQKEAVERRGRKRQRKGEEERGSGKERKKEAVERKKEAVERRGRKRQWKGKKYIINIYYSPLLPYLNAFICLWPTGVPDAIRQAFKMHNTCQLLNDIVISTLTHLQTLHNGNTIIHFIVHPQALKHICSNGCLICKQLTKAQLPMPLHTCI